METLNNIGKIISHINDELYDQLEHDEIYLEMISVGHMTIIKFLGIQLWNSENDERQEIHEEIYEPLEQFLIDECNKIMITLAGVQIE